MQTYHKFTYTPAAIGRGLDLFAGGNFCGCVLLKDGGLAEGFYAICDGFQLLPKVATVFGVINEEAGPLYFRMARAALEEAIAKGVI